MIPVAILAVAEESDREFMIRFYENNVKRMYCEARKLISCAQDVEDVVSEAVVKLVSKRELLLEMDERRRMAYAVTTVRHVAIHALEHKGCFQTVSLAALEKQRFGEPSPEENLLQEQRNLHLQELFQALPVEDVLLLEEKYILQWSDTEIAEGLGIRRDSVRMRITRVKRKVAKLLTEQGFLLSEWI